MQKRPDVKISNALAELLLKQITTKDPKECKTMEELADSINAVNSLKGRHIAVNSREDEYLEKIKKLEKELKELKKE
jgi:dynactin complex subunit